MVAHGRSEEVGRGDFRDEHDHARQPRLCENLTRLTVEGVQQGGALDVAQPCRPCPALQIAFWFRYGQAKN